MNPAAPVLDQPVLSSQQRDALRARAHPLKPVVMISTNGASAAVIAEIDRALTHHELIKIRVLDAGRDEREALLGAVCTSTGAQPVQHIGKILVIYRPTPKEPAAKSPAEKPSVRRPARKAAAPASRSRRAAPSAERPARRGGSDPSRFVSAERRRLQRRRTTR